MKSAIKIFAGAACAVLALAGCGSAVKADSLGEACTVADSIADAEADGAVVIDNRSLQASFEILDPEIAVDRIGQELFDVFAAQQLKRISAADINLVCEALRASGGDFVTVLNSPDGTSAVFTLTPRQIVHLQRAKNSDLNLGVARNQVIAVAEMMCPNPAAHTGASRVDVSVSKSFLEYNIVWPKASAYERYPQGILTSNYFNALKTQYRQMGGLAERVIAMLQTMGIDGVRIVYSAENSDKQLRQAFPWREIRMPVEDGRNN